MKAAFSRIAPAPRARLVFGQGIGRRLAIAVGTAAIAAIGLLLASRRVSGALVTNLGAAGVAATATVVSALIWGGRFLWRRSAAGSERSSAYADQALGWGGSIALVLVLAGCAGPNTRDWAWLLWLPWVVADQVARQLFLRGTRWPIGVDTDAFAAADAGRDVAAMESSDRVLQRIVRIVDARGAEMIQATLRADFAAGQRHATLHVSFCPPLPRLPHIETELGEGPEATVRVVQAFAHGARLEVRLSDPTQAPCSLLVDLAATPNGDQAAENQ